MKADRFPFLFGPYPIPYFRIGDEVFCERKGLVVIVGIHQARIGPWPKVRRGREKAASILLAGNLVEAVRRESAQAVGYWWGVGSFTVWTWRKALGVPAVTKGTSFLKIKNFLDGAGKKARAALVHVQGSPERRAKIAAAKRGKPRPPHLIAALRKANLGRRPSRKTRKKMSAAQKAHWAQRGWPAWSAAEMALLRKLPPAEVARKTGRSLKAIYSRRAMVKSR